jgi:hypothetical protein
MAETLGSLVDKLTIKSLREMNINRMLEEDSQKFSKEELQEKLKTLAKQKQQLVEEIEEFVVRAAKGEIPLRDDKLKLYNKKEFMNNIEGADSLAAAIDSLARKNAELWSLEDQARRDDVELDYIGKVKQRIDKANQQRNDYIDAIDKLLEAAIKGGK